MSTSLPNDVKCIDILYEVGCKKRVIVHCCTVRAVAEEMMNHIRPVDAPLVIAGSLLHDMGRAVDHTIMHASIGAKMAEDLGLPRELVDIIRKHTGAGLDDEDVLELGLPAGDYMPRTLEEKIVAHADNLVSDNKVVNHKYSVDKLRSKGATRGADRMESLHWELSKLYGRDLDVIPEIIGEYPKLKGIIS